MSQNYPHRLPPSDTDIRMDRAPNGSVDRRRPSGNAYRPPQDSYPSSYLASSSSSSSSARSAAVPQDVLGILSSCGLEPDDLARLAELPEDVLTVESLPHILQQMKGKRGTVRAFTSTTSGYSFSSFSSSSHHPSPASRPAVDWDQVRSQPVQYPLISSTRIPSEKVQGHRTSSSVRADPPSSSSGHMVDMDLRACPSKYGKTGPVPSFNPSGRGQRPCASRFSDAGLPDQQVPPAPPPHQRHRHPPHAPPPPPPPTNKPWWGHQESASSSSRSSQAPAPMPTKKQAVDFHGTLPSVFPYACALCDITVLSEKVWIQHINSTQHADGQLNLLQEFPKWDCRIETVSSDENQSESRKDKKKPTAPDRKKHTTQPSKTSHKKTADKGKVVCIKFPAQSVDETYLRKLTEPFGKIVKILMFPSLAFVELGSVDQAKDLVKFHSNYPPTVNGEQMEFSISSTFNFLQSSQVASFTPAPVGQDARSDLISIIKRFGTPLYTLFLPSKAFVEMTTVAEAQKLVDYYSSNVLRLNSTCIKVSFSGEYRTLAQVALARKYKEEERRPTKRARSSTQEGDKRKRSRSPDSSRDCKTRSRSREKRTRTRSRSRDKKAASNSRSTGKSDSVRRTRTRSRSRSKSKDESKKSSRSKEESSGEKQTRPVSKSRSEEKSCKAPSRETGSESGSRENPGAPTAPAPVEDSKGEEVEEEEEDDEGLSVDDSDIEGMEVIGGEVEEEEEEEEGEGEEEERQEEEGEGRAAEEDPSPPQEIQSAEQCDEEHHEKEGKHHGQEIIEEEQQEQDGEDPGQEKAEEEEKENEEPNEETEMEEEREEDEGFPVDLENCITLDELVEEEEEACEESGEEAAGDSQSSRGRVLYISNLPPRFYTDAEFLALVAGFGTAVRYLLIRSRREGFVEMSRAAEASRAARELSSRCVSLHSSTLTVRLSNKYSQLTNGWVIQPEDSEKRRTRSSSRRSEKGGGSTSAEQDRKGRRLKGRREIKKTPEEEVRNTSEKESAATETSEETSTETPEKTTTPRKTPEKTPMSTETPEKTTTSRKTPEETPMSTETPEKTTTSRKTPEETPMSTETPEKMTTSRKTPEKTPMSTETPEKTTTSRKTPEKMTTSRKTPEKTPMSTETPEKTTTSRKTPEEMPMSTETPEKTTMSRKTPEETPMSTETPEKTTTSRKTPEKTTTSRKTPEKTPMSTETPEKTLALRVTPEEEVQQKTKSSKDKMSKIEKSSVSGQTPEEEQQRKSPQKETTKREVSEDKRKVPTDNSVPETTAKTEPPEGTRLVCEAVEEENKEGKDSGVTDQRVSDEPTDEPKSTQAEEMVPTEEPAHVSEAAAPQKPSKPVGAEFVRPVVGYFCNLCQLIFADEDEAKQDHCSTAAHYIRYQEKTGKDPWVS